MAKYLFEGHYNAEGTKGLVRDGGSSRRAAITKLVEGHGGKLEAVYYAFGDVDVYVIADLPDNKAATSMALTVNQTGIVSVKTVVLMTPEEVDNLGDHAPHYRAPGR